LVQSPYVAMLPANNPISRSLMLVYSKAFCVPFWYYSWFRRLTFDNAWRRYNLDTSASATLPNGPDRSDRVAIRRYSVWMDVSMPWPRPNGRGVALGTSSLSSGTRAPTNLVRGL
jgi:hypothetical protein